MAEVVECYLRVHQEYQRHGIDVRYRESTHHSPSLEAITPCEKCGKNFANHQKLAIHRWKAHGLISEERRLIRGPICPGCKWNLWTAQRMQQHLRQSRQRGATCYRVAKETIAPTQHPIPVVPPPHLQTLHRLPAMYAGSPCQHPPEDPSTTCWNRWGISPQHMTTAERQRLEQQWQEALDKWRNHPDRKADNLADAWIDIADEAELTNHNEIFYAFYQWSRRHQVEGMYDPT